MDRLGSTNSSFKPPKVETILIAAFGRDFIIGNRKKNSLPWHYPEDLAFFRQMTVGFENVVVMGGKTWDSLPSTKCGERLPGRFKIVISRKARSPEVNTIFLKNWDPKVIRTQARLMKATKIFVIGGENIFTQAIESCQKAFITRINDYHQGDVYFPINIFEDYFGEEVLCKRLNPKLDVFSYKNIKYYLTVKSISVEKEERMRRLRGSTTRIFDGTSRINGRFFTDIDVGETRFPADEYPITRTIQI